MLELSVQNAAQRKSLSIDLIYLLGTINVKYVAVILNPLKIHNFFLYNLLKGKIREIIIMDNEYIEIKLSGENIFPETVKVKDLIDILQSIQSSIIFIIEDKNPEITLDNVVISLAKIESGSERLIFSLCGVAVSAFLFLSTAINNNDFVDLPYKAIEPLENISKFTRKKNCHIEFKRYQDDSILARIDPETEISIPESFLLKGSTTIYGFIERVGGKSPLVRIRTNNKVISCKVSAELAKKLAKYLYSWVGLYGNAIWNIKNFSIMNFSIENITEYKNINIYENMQKLSEQYHEYFENIEDVKKHISDLRGNTEEL